jgi:hypothetical protein
LRITIDVSASGDRNLKEYNADTTNKACTPSPDQPKIETIEATGASVPQRSNSDPLPQTKSRFTFRAVAQSIMKVLALQKGNSEPSQEG